MEYSPPMESLKRLQGIQDPGLYYIRAKSEDVIRNLSMELYEEFINREPSDDPLLIYIGKADGQEGLRQRLRQELCHKGEGTFFRGIGAIMDKNPERAKSRAGVKNYRFGEEDVKEIICFIEQNFEVSVLVKYDNNIDCFEKREIQKNIPLLNTKHNPFPSKVLRQARSRCRAYAAEFLK